MGELRGIKLGQALSLHIMVKLVWFSERLAKEWIYYGFIYLIFCHCGLLDVETHCPSLATMKQPSTFGSSSSKLAVVAEIRSKACVSHFTVGWCSEGPGCCQGPLPAIFVFLILTSLPLLIHREQPKQNVNTPLPTLHKFTFFTIFTDSFFFSQILY